jgi:hypothetical protein
MYIQLQKTGCTHISSLLADLFDGIQIGKHNAATEDQIASSPFIVSSIRNPWDWYLSLWTFGVQGNGGLRNRLTNKNYKQSIKSAIKSPKRNYRSILNEREKDVELWRGLYDHNGSVESFRSWLQQIHSAKNSRYLGEGYGESCVSHLCGFMTYRYLYLCCRKADLIGGYRAISSFSELVQFEKSNCYIDFFIRQESLEDDFCRAIEQVRKLSEEEKQSIYSAKKTNTSKRTLTISDYYDEDSIELVRKRDRLLIEKFDYSPPKITAQ